VSRHTDTLCEIHADRRGQLRALPAKSQRKVPRVKHTCVGAVGSSGTPEAENDDRQCDEKDRGLVEGLLRDEHARREEDEDEEAGHEAVDDRAPHGSAALEAAHVDVDDLPAPDNPTRHEIYRGDDNNEGRHDGVGPGSDEDKHHDAKLAAVAYRRWRRERRRVALGDHSAALPAASASAMGGESGPSGSEPEVHACSAEQLFNTCSAALSPVRALHRLRKNKTAQPDAPPREATRCALEQPAPDTAVDEDEAKGHEAKGTDGEVVDEEVAASRKALPEGVADRAGPVDEACDVLRD
jgi:hypothetical protein